VAYDAGPDQPEASPSIALTDSEITLLDRLVTDAGNRPFRPGTLSFYLTKLARLGGYLARAGDPPPGSVIASCRVDAKKALRRASFRNALDSCWKQAAQIAISGA
jgi:hypothetical protein